MVKIAYSVLTNIHQIVSDSLCQFLYGFKLPTVHVSSTFQNASNIFNNAKIWGLCGPIKYRNMQVSSHIFIYSDQIDNSPTCIGIRSF